MRKLPIWVVLGMLFAILFSNHAEAAAKPGGSCTSLAILKTIGGQKFFCGFSSNKKLTWQKTVRSNNKIGSGSTFYIYLSSKTDCITDGKSDLSEGDQVRLLDLVGGSGDTQLISRTTLYTREAGCSFGASFYLNSPVIGNQVSVYHPKSDQILAFLPPTKDCSCHIEIKVVANPQESILDNPAADYFLPGSSLITLQRVWGISLNTAIGAKSFRQVADEIYLYLNSAVGHKVTQVELENSFQFGNSMQVFFSRLIDNTWAYQAMKDRLIFNANQ